MAATLNAGIAPTASPESPSPTEQNLPRVLWDRPPGRAGAAASEVPPRPPSAPGGQSQQSPHAAAPAECSPLLPPRGRTDFVVQRGAEQSEILRPGRNLCVQQLVFGASNVLGANSIGV